MSNKKYFSYIRVSTQRQGQHGTSLAEQQASIERFADTWNLPIAKRFEERETAAKQGRPVFLDMLKQLRQGKAQGVIIHKIDRSARNLKDWADLGSLIDSGLEVHFASESLDLSSRGGRLSADIQAVVASDFIRNLRQETIKGLYGRLKQGLYPFPAVIGYLDGGAGQPKRIDPVAGPLVRKAFELYATGDLGLNGLSDQMFRKGLRNKQGGKVTLNGLSTMFHNPFYLGVIRIEKTGEHFAGIHKPIVSRATFNRVQEVLGGKNIKKQASHWFLFRQMARCSMCRRSYIPERQKGLVYYRCQKRGCTRGSVREELIESAFSEMLKSLKFSGDENRFFRNGFQKAISQIEETQEFEEKRITIRLKNIEERLGRLTDAVLDGLFDKDAYLERKNSLILEKAELEAKLAGTWKKPADIIEDVEIFLELINSAQIKYKSTDPEQRRDLVKSIVSNFDVKGKSVLVRLNSPFDLIANRPAFTAGSPRYDTSRTVSVLISQLLKFFTENRLFDDGEKISSGPLFRSPMTNDSSPPLPILRTPGFIRYPHCKLKPTPH